MLIGGGPVNANVLPFNMRLLRIQFSLKALLACVILMASACWFALPFRPSIDISELAIEAGTIDQQGVFTLSAKITNCGYGTVYVQSVGDSSCALSMVWLADLEPGSEECWLPFVETRWFRINSLYEEPKRTWRPLRPGESITIRNHFINSLSNSDGSDVKLFLTVADWRGRSAIMERKPFDLHSIPSHDKLTYKAEQSHAHEALDRASLTCVEPTPRAR